MFPQERASRSAPTFFQGIMSRTAYDYALDLLAARAYTTRNLRRKLVQKAFDPAVVEPAIERLVAAGLLDDERYAAAYARQKLVIAGASVRRVEQELVRKGISREVAKVKVSSVAEEEAVDASSSIRRVASKKLASLGDIDPLVKRRRVFGLLARRGYEIDDINRVLRELLPRRE